MLIENSLVKLRPMQLEDVDAIYEVAKYPEIWTHMSINVNGKEDVLKYVESALKTKETGTEIPLVIIDGQTNKIIGSTKLMDIDKKHKRGEIGFTWLTPSYWRTAINTNCKYLLLSYCFEVLEWNRVQIKTDHENFRSQKAIERIGAKKEGILRNHMVRKDGTIRHTVMYSIIKDEWPETKQYIEQLLK
ncbi:GNAT family N-acetyltransferase [Lysinibacillus endophyticus]|uniref:N-acetyltransferase n=1 Tax=Ureibacillus endophyticus TaxID=1978490 RepID=A0A494Z0M9_9BACL|nr:GNAT family protein [Lysinibacillus endophyticus]RKQ15921.1 N-acetyltransferase [Lysinibacillus endophyticus]